ncbi:MULTISPECIES: hypothetical protein [Pseudomonas]|jgi:hypothetical protein|uniref:Uncharacterized protein n=1 Tax=Pseudomonas umsongensis TaxID=198618 RepID=A0ACC5MDP9_9PSED|nr:MULTISPECIES: hypothetical protein [Pseudomonas]MBB2886799.1 hypothetical protein [Pseudomonas umsongensis]NMN76785.1 hypothetical protein [Pseudomonas sp. KD5]GID08551.1 hypothetical protein TMM008_57530 [Pseudomonas sp. 008]
MKLDSNPDFEILGFSDSRYEKLTIEIQYKGESVAQINQDQGVDKLELEVFADLNNSVLKIPLAGFLESMILAKRSIEG